jgi:hypothetical protein
MPYGIINADLITTSDGVSSAGLYGFKNRIINGDMRIDQRNAGASVTLSTTTQYPVDRFPAYKGTSGATVTAQRSTTAPAGFTNSVIFTASTGATPAVGDINATWQFIEGFNFADMAWGTANAQTITLSFWVRSSVTGTYSVSFANSAVNRFYVATYAVNSANTWEQKTITISGDTSGTWATDNSAAVQVTFDLGYGTNFNGSAGSWGSSAIRRTSGSVQFVATTGATFYITGVQLEKGSTATSFDYLDYGRSLMQCQRYYFKIQATGDVYPFGTGYNSGTTTALGYTPFPVPLRANPTAFEQSGTASHYKVRHGTTETVCSAIPSAVTSSQYSGNTTFTVASGLTAGQGSMLWSGSASAYLAWSAEL